MRRERERERMAGIRPRERKCHFFDTGHQNVRFLFQMVPYNEESLTWVFFTLKVPKKTRFEVWKKLVSELILSFWLFFALLEVEDWFKKVNKVISSCLGWKWVSRRKTSTTLIFWPLWWLESRYDERCLTCLFFYIKKVTLPII